MLWIVKEGLGNASNGTDGIEVNGGALTLHLGDGCNNAATSVLTLFPRPSAQWPVCSASTSSPAASVLLALLWG